MFFLEILSQGGFLVIWASPWECQPLERLQWNKVETFETSPEVTGNCTMADLDRLVFQKSVKFLLNLEVPFHFKNQTFWP